jgi:two-component system, OmpR family, sensor histidine kinase TctE
MLRLKQSLKPQSIRYQLFQWLLILILPFILVSSIASYWVAHRYINQAYDKTLYRSALALASQVSLEELGAQISLPRVAKNLLEYDEEDAIYFRIIGPKGDLIDSHTALPLPKVYPNSDELLYYNTWLNEDQLRVVIYALPELASYAPDAQDNHVYVLVGETLTKRKLMTDEIIISTLLPQLLIAILIGGGLFFGIKRGLLPIEILKNNLIQRNANDLSPIDNSKVPTELQPLLSAFNDLLKRLGFTMAKQQRFVSDAAHQLRTPLAGLKTQAELALREENPTKIKHALNQINQASGNLSHLVAQLLNLTKAEPDNPTYSFFEDIDLTVLAQEVCIEWVSIALQKNIDLGFQTEEKSALIKGNAVLLRELMNNLIDNAIRYTPNDGSITVSIQKKSNFIILYVQDNGLGIPVDEQARIFERFYRVLGTQQEGSGLGLSIVQEIAERHQATVSLLSGEDSEGTVFMVSFPCD